MSPRLVARLVSHAFTFSTTSVSQAPSQAGLFLVRCLPQHVSVLLWLLLRCCLRSRCLSLSVLRCHVSTLATRRLRIDVRPSHRGRHGQETSKGIVDPGEARRTASQGKPKARGDTRSKSPHRDTRNKEKKRIETCGKRERWEA